MKKDAIKIIHDNKVSLKAVNKSIKDFVENLVDDVLGSEEGGAARIKKHIQAHNEKITPYLVELVQLHLDNKGKTSDEVTKAKISLTYQLFKAGFDEIMEHTKFGFYQFIYEAWYHIMMGLCKEANKEGNKKINDLSLALFRDISKAYKLADKENKKEFRAKE